MSAIQCVWPVATRSVLLAIFLFGTQAYAYDELTFTTIERVRTRTDDRERMITLNFYFSPSNRVDYELRETPYGSLMPKVKSIELQRETDITPEEGRAFADRLVSAGLFSLPKSEEHRVENIWSIFGSLRGHTFQLSYRQPPNTGVRKRVDDTVQAIAHKLNLDKVEGPTFAKVLREGETKHLVLPDNDPRTKTPAVTETEGDKIPPKYTTLRELLVRATEYDGKRVSIIGFYHPEFEGNELRLDEKSDEKENVWCDVISSFTSKDVEFKADCWARVEGTFLKGPSGHFGMWPGEITRVTRFDVQTKPTLARR